MRIDIITLFPEMCETFLNESIIGRARKSGKVEFVCHQLRDYAYDKHRRVDDSTYGGGMGMLMKAEPIALCFEDICRQLTKRPHFIYMSPKGKVLTQKRVKELAQLENIVILCGHYEGVDQRVLDEYVDETISIGDYVLTGGELPALVLADSISRMIPEVLSNDLCFEEESHYNGLLEYPQYTINKWRRERSLEETAKNRPDMLEKADLTDKERKYISEYLKEIKN